MKGVGIFATTICLLCEPAHTALGEVDVFMRAVGFALTGSDDAEPVAVDRRNCVFKISDDIFRLNNIQTDRIKNSGMATINDLRASEVGDGEPTRR